MFSNEFSNYLNGNYKLDQDLIRRIFSNQIDSFDEIVDILKNDTYAINEFGQNTDLQELHRYQEFIDIDPTQEVKAEDIAANSIFDLDEDLQNSIKQLGIFKEFDHY